MMLRNFPHSKSQLNSFVISFVLADTEKLHQKIADMSDRIRQLEDALAILQSTLTCEPHPMLHRDLLKIKSSIELHSAVDADTTALTEQEESEDTQYIDSFGTLAIRDDGAATFYGRSAGSEVSFLLFVVGRSDSTSKRVRSPPACRLCRIGETPQPFNLFPPRLPSHTLT
jgi:hypothetical protein